MKRYDILKREGARIRKMRLSSGLSQRAVAELLGVTQAAISHIEHGKIDSLSLYIQIREVISNENKRHTES